MNKPVRSLLLSKSDKPQGHTIDDLIQILFSLGKENENMTLPEGLQRALGIMGLNLQAVAQPGNSGSSEAPSRDQPRIEGYTDENRGLFPLQTAGGRTGYLARPGASGSGPQVNLKPIPNTLPSDSRNMNTNSPANVRAQKEAEILKEMQSLTPIDLNNLHSDTPIRKVKSLLLQKD